MTSEEIGAALLGRVNAILKERSDCEPAKSRQIMALCQALGELMGDDEEDGLTPRKEEE